MSDVAIIYPVLVQVAMTFILLFWMGRERIGAYRRNEIEPTPVGVRPAWKGRAGIVSNAFHNQHEMPTLFYAVVAFAMITSGVDDTLVMMAWAYVLVRVVHAAIHTTYNHVPHRFIAYLVSNFILLAMWLKLALHVA